MRISKWLCGCPYAFGTFHNKQPHPLANVRGFFIFTNMEISQNLRSLLEQGYSAGGEPELAKQLAKAFRIKGKFDALIKVVQSDLNVIWNSVIFAYTETQYQAFINEALKCAINYLITDKPIVLVIKDDSLVSINGVTLSGLFTGANEARNRLKNKLKALSIRLQYGGESEYFLIQPINKQYYEI